MKIMPVATRTEVQRRTSNAAKREVKKGACKHMSVRGNEGRTNGDRNPQRGKGRGWKKDSRRIEAE